MFIITVKENPTVSLKCYALFSAIKIVIVSFNSRMLHVPFWMCVEIPKVVFYRFILSVWIMSLKILHIIK